MFDIRKIQKGLDSGEAVLIDVRTGDERLSDGYADGSLHLDLARLNGGVLPECSKDTDIYVYCRSGGRAGMACQLLEAAGFSSVSNIGGLHDWVEAGGKVERQ
ncbi:MAG: rhodanese-like domain-containing protein [Candidatus Pacebacteria bacterium]|nr:rhodanese-like domain-containing protein [Candidatus Paceibacterota bacterium]